MSTPAPLFWLLDVEAYDFDIGVLKKTDLTGKALIISRQLWSIIRETLVVSILIGPGVFKGVAESGNRRVDILEQLSAMIFDPSQLRFDEPVPIVDIISPEVIDPLGERKEEEIVTLIKNLMVERGNVLAVDPLMHVETNGSVPQTAYYDEIMKRINVAHVSGVQRAKFILGGTNRPLYKPMVEWYNNRKYIHPERLKVMATSFNKFGSFVDIEMMSDWTIVEKAGMDTKTGIEAIKDEYEQTLNAVDKKSESFMFEL